MYNKVINIFLRSATLGSKFFLLIFLAKYLKPSELGVYGLLTASISYSLLVIGFDFYTFSNRELIRTIRYEWSAKLRDQAVFYLIIYLILLPFFILLFSLDIISWRYVTWFFLLLVFEHIAQELNRLFIIMSEQLLASFILFIRSGIWCFLVVPFMAIFPNYRTIETVLFAWIIGVLAACFLAASRLRRLDRTALLNNIDWKWIKSGVKIAAPMLCATLSVRGLFTFDRYFVNELSGGDVLGAYVLFMSIANSFLSFLDAGVITFMYPKLIELAHNDKFVLFNKNMKDLIFQSVLILLSMSVVTSLLLKPLLRWIGKTIYLDHLSIFYMLIAAICLFSLSLIPQIALYSFNKDKPIILSHVAGLISFFVLVLLCKNHLGYLTVPGALTGACFVILTLKSFAFFKLRRFISSQTQKG